MQLSFSPELLADVAILQNKIPGKLWNYMYYILKPISYFLCSSVQNDPRPGTGPQPVGWGPLLYRILEGSWEFTQPVVMCFVSLGKAVSLIAFCLGGVHGVQGPLISASMDMNSRIQDAEISFFHSWCFYTLRGTSWVAQASISDASLGRCSRHEKGAGKTQDTLGGLRPSADLGMPWDPTGWAWGSVHRLF